ncbi:MAG: glycosyltransferase family 4 protein [Porphyromonadaceae bacterium]|nr:glycosyltransferase family 4 protein [Porphyromonadaceae bacterium]
MKIVYCITSLYNSGGMERVLSCKANYLAAQGHEVHIITTDQRRQPTFFDLDTRIILHDLDVNHEETTGSSVWRKVSAYPFKHWRHQRRLTKLLMKLKADVVVSMFGLEVGIVPRVKDGSLKVLEYHFSKNKRLEYGRTGLWRLIDQWRTKQDERFVGLYDHFVVLTEEDKALWGDLPNICAIPNPLPFNSSEVSSLQERVVVAAGRYDYQKNFEALIDIWKLLAERYPDWTLKIYGDGRLRPELEQQVQTLGLAERVRLEPPSRDMKSVYLSSSIYALTSHYEGLPMVLLEAQTMGLPIVAYACQCGPRDVISDGKDGYIIDPGDKVSFAQALERLMVDHDLRLSMGREARKASGRYELERVMEQWLALLKID